MKISTLFSYAGCFTNNQYLAVKSVYPAGVLCSVDVALAVPTNIDEPLITSLPEAIPVDFSPHAGSGLTASEGAMTKLARVETMNIVLWGGCLNQNDKIY